MLIGSYFTQEYALESAALFNPSMVWHPDQSGLRRGLAPVRAQPAGHRRGAYLVDHLPQRDGRRREPHPHGRADPVRHRAGAGAQHALRQEPVLPQAGRAGRRRPVHRPGPGHAQRPVHARRAPAGRSAAAVHQSRPRHHELEPVAQGMLTLAKANYEISYSPRAARLRADHLPLLAHRDQRHRGRPVRPVPRRRRLGPLLRHLHRLRRQGDPAADPRDRRLPPLQDQHPERPRGPQQGLRALPPQGQRPLRHALAAGQREHLPDVLGHAPLLVHQGADRQADVLRGSSCSSATAARRSRPRPAGWS